MAPRNNYPGARNQQHLKKIMEQIRTSALPSVPVTPEWLKRFGIDNNNAIVLPVLKFLDFIDTKGMITDNWRAYKTRGGKFLAEKLKEKYAELFSDYPNAQTLNIETLKTYFQANHLGSSRTMNAIITTFKTLCSLSDFENTEIPAPTPDSIDLPDTSLTQLSSIQPESPLPNSHNMLGINNAPAVNINIQLQVPETDNPEVYERFFKAMREYLFDGKDS